MAPRRSGPSEEEERLARLIRALREEAGLSVRELARRMGVGATTLSAVERGRRQPRSSTLRLLAEHLPGATPRLLLAPECMLPEPASPAVHEWLAARFGFSAEAVRLTRLPEGWELRVSGVSGTRNRPALLLAWARAICAGSSDFIRALAHDDLSGRSVDGDREHVFDLDPASGRLGYLCRATDAVEDTFAVTYPVQELLLEAIAPDTGQVTPRVRVFRMGQPVDDAHEIGRYVHPSGLAISTDRRAGRVTARVPHPMVGARYVLEFGSAISGSGRRRAVDAGRAVRSARERAGLSQRELARLADLPQPTVREVEGGSDPQAATMRALLCALPELSPQELLGAGSGGGATAEAYWSHAIRFAGITADEVVKVIEIGADGGKAERIRTRAIRSIDPTASGWEVRVGLRRALLQRSPRVLAEIESADARVKARRLPLSDGADLHLFRFTGDGATSGFSYTRVYEHEGKYTLWAEEIRRATGLAGPHRAGADLPVDYPLGSCRISLVFPPGYEPLDLRAHAWPAGFLPDEPLISESYLPARALRRAYRNGRLAVHLSVRRPTPGVRYAISWQLP